MDLKLYIKNTIILIINLKNMFTKKIILDSLEGVELSGFTKPLLWELKRYIVAYTNNTHWLDIELLAIQANWGFTRGLKNINIWGWEDNKTGKLYIDISTSFDELTSAKKFWKETKQIAIWDNLEFKEIRIEY